MMLLKLLSGYAYLKVLNVCRKAGSYYTARMNMAMGDVTRAQERVENGEDVELNKRRFIMATNECVKYIRLAAKWHDRFDKVAASAKKHCDIFKG